MTRPKPRLSWRAPLLGLAGLAQLMSLAGHDWANGGGVQFGPSGGLACALGTCKPWSWESIRVSERVIFASHVAIAVGIVAAAVTLSAAIAAARRRLGPRLVAVTCALAALSLATSAVFTYLLFTAFNHTPSPTKGLFVMFGALVVVLLVARQVGPPAGDAGDADPG